MNDSIREQTKRYLRQQQDLFGNTILLDVPASSARSSLPEFNVQQPSPEPMPGKGNALFPEDDTAWFTEQIGLLREEWASASSLASLDQMICNCLKCPLGKTRKNFVFGVGNPQADLVVIGEAPGADEDAQGEPFVGKAGQLLNKILAAIHFERDDVFICNILKCRPPGNRTPDPSEVDKCIPYLHKQLDLLKPKFILAVGLTAANNLLGKKARMKELRGHVHDYHGINVIVTYHPAALLRNPQWKHATWEDVQMLRRMYDEWKESTTS